MTWDDALAGWWLDEVAGDPAYSDEIIPLTMELLDAGPGMTVLDLGCGEGQVMRAVAGTGAVPVGCDLLPELAERARGAGAVVVGRLPDLGWLRPGSVDAAVAVLVLEHLDAVEPLFAAASVAVRPGGVLIAVLNHPAFTSPGSGPFIDPDDGEPLWRWGPYLEPGFSREPAGEATVVFHHRPMGELLTAAAGAGWALERLVELGVGAGGASDDPLLARQRHIPRILGVRWRAAQR